MDFRRFVIVGLVISATLSCTNDEPIEPEPEVELDPITFKRSPTQTCRFEGHVDGVIDEIEFLPRMTWANLQNPKQLFPLDDNFLVNDSEGLKILKPTTEETVLIWEPLPSETIRSIAVKDDSIFLAVDNAGQFSVTMHSVENESLSEGELMVSIGDVLSMSVAVDEDGYLVVAVGEKYLTAIDSVYANDGKTVEGGILRIDPANPTVPITHNPAYGDTAGLVYATGVRKPAGCVSDAKGLLWCADQGPKFAEVHRVRKAANLGWPEYDGSACAKDERCKFSLDHIPQAKFERANEDCGILLGSVYNSSKNPTLRDTLYFANTCENRIHALLLSSPDRYWWDGPAGKIDSKITGMGSSEEGNVFVLVEEGIFEISIKNKGSFPTRISESGCFEANGKTKGMIPYDINAALWTDGASKDRWIEIPPETTIDTSDPTALIFPKGSVLAKNFSYDIDGEERVVETRIMLRGEFGWEYHTYRWDDDGKDATLLQEKEDAILVTNQNVENVFSGDLPDSKNTSDDEKVEVQIRHLFPDRANCKMCHGSTLEVLGPRLDQMNKTFKIQHTEFDGLKLLEDVKYIPEDSTTQPMVDYHDENAPVGKRARSFLHTNCSHCHRPGGWKPSTLNMDLRYEQSFQDTNTCDIESISGTFLIDQGPRIKPGDAEGSILYQRLTGIGLEKMPPIGRSIVPNLGASIVKEWIDGLENCPE